MGAVNVMPTAEFPTLWRYPAKTAGCSHFFLARLKKLKCGGANFFSCPSLPNLMKMQVLISGA
jgi:hypothetical protein